MGFSLEQRNNSKEQNRSSIEDNVVQPQTSRRTRHIEKAKVRTGAGLKQNDLHQNARQDAGDGASGQEKFSGNRSRESMKGNNAGKVDELVKHMSNLPGYLQRPERGEKIQEKVLNVGVLDWGRLEKWKHKQKPFPEKGSGSSSSERTTGKSTSSVVVHNGTNAEELSSGCSSLKSSQKDGLSQGVKPSVHKDVRFQDSKTASKNAIYGQKKISIPYRSLGRNHSDMMLDKGKAKDSDQKFTSETGNMAANLKSYGVSLNQKHEMSTRHGRAKKTKDLQESDIKRKDIHQGIITEKGVPSSKLEGFDVSLSSEGKTIACHGKTEKRVEELHKSVTNLAHQHCPSAENPVVVSPPKELPQNDFPEVLQLSKPRASWDECMAEADKISFSGNFSTKEMDFAEFSSEVSHSCPLPSAVETNTASNMLLNSTINGNSVGLSFVPSHMSRCSTQDLLYDDKFVHKKNSEKMLTRSSFDTSSTLDQEDVELATRKGRSPTPIRRFNFSLGRLGRSLSFKEISDIPQLSSTYTTVKSGPVRSGTSDFPDNPNREKASTHNRARSSPLRRLLDPILKHKEANLHHSAEAVRPPKSNFNSLVPKPINISESLENLKAEASWVKAFLQITIKNGLPLFKFWVDNNSNCFAATMKNLSSGKDDFCQYFTFYCINEVKRKSGGWMSQGSKGKSCRYAYNIVAQMKVSSSDLSDVNGQDLSKYMVREAVLLDVDLTQADQESPSVVPHRELAAAVVKLPRKDLSHPEQQSDEEVMEKGCVKGSSEDYSWEDSTIVILPGGVHSSPNTGEPSPLLDRWKSGGLCDCGGWDVGCKLRVLSNQNKCCWIPKTSSACYPFPETFELFAEEGAQQNRPIFSLAPGKDGSYSIEFNTSLSLLQAFFICVVVISSCRPSDLSEVSNVLEAKEFQEPNLNRSNGIQVTGPAKYAPNPPLSPVGRV
ncbi:hypothetical protein ACFX15_032161 [Malus domestica]